MATTLLCYEVGDFPKTAESLAGTHGKINGVREFCNIFYTLLHVTKLH